MSSEYNYLIKVVFVGAQTVGKSMVLLQGTDRRFTSEYARTIGVEFGTRIFQVADKKVKLQIWDTAGDEDFRAITRSYYRGAHVVCPMWDADAKHAVEILEDRSKEAESFVAENTPFVFARTKIDLDKEKKITSEKVQEQKDQIKAFARENATIRETSAKTGQGIDEFLQHVAEVGLQVALDRGDKPVNYYGAGRGRRDSAAAAPARAPEIPGRIERMSHSRTVRETHLNQDGLDSMWLKLHLASVETNCRTARNIREKLNLRGEELQLTGPQLHDFAPVLELLRELDSDERAFKYKFCIFFTFESYSTRIVAERNQQVRQVILDVAFRLFNIAQFKGWKSGVPTAEELYGDLRPEQVPEKVREILERRYPNLHQEQTTSLTG